MKTAMKERIFGKRKVDAGNRRLGRLLDREEQEKGEVDGNEEWNVVEKRSRCSKLSMEWIFRVDIQIMKNNIENYYLLSALDKSKTDHKRDCIRPSIKST